MCPEIPLPQGRASTDNVLESVPTREEELGLLRAYNPSIRWEDREHEGFETRLLKCGSKELLLYFLGDEFSTVVVGGSGGKIKGETTKLYIAAKKIMQEKADLLGKMVAYSISTSNESMIKWAREAGENIFHWQKIIEPNKSQKEWYFLVRLTPTAQLREAQENVPAAHKLE